MITSKTSKSHAKAITPSKVYSITNIEILKQIPIIHWKLLEQTQKRVQQVLFRILTVKLSVIPRNTILFVSGDIDLTSNIIYFSNHVLGKVSNEITAEYDLSLGNCSC